MKSPLTTVPESGIILSFQPSHLALTHFLCPNTTLRPSGQQCHILELTEHSGWTDFTSTKLGTRQKNISPVSYFQL